MSSAAPPNPALEEWLYPANLLTELRLLAVPLAVVAVAFGRYGWTLAVFVAAAVSDGLDGWVARRLNQRSSLGMVLDPLADKLLLTALFLALAVTQVLPWALTVLVVLRDICIVVSALVLVRFTRFRDFRPTWWGKAATTAELATVGVALLDAAAPNPITRGVEIFGWVSVAFLAVVSGAHYAFAAARRYHTARTAQRNAT
ncbi:MAG: CDP-alcohol phosphatidyltransferase family protein [Terriglobales bacterium]